MDLHSLKCPVSFAGLLLNLGPPSTLCSSSNTAVSQKSRTYGSLVLWLFSLLLKPVNSSQLQNTLFKVFLIPNMISSFMFTPQICEYLYCISSKFLIIKDICLLKNKAPKVYKEWQNDRAPTSPQVTPTKIFMYLHSLQISSSAS